VTATSYVSDTVTITITTYRAYDTNIYVADIQLADASDLATAFADSTYGKNITETTSSIAESVNAILAINGDYYSARSGYVIRNGVLYRSTSAGADQQDLVIYADGTFDIVSEGDVTAEELLNAGAMQVLSFGPALVTDGAVAVDTDAEVDQAMTTNPRTAIGQIGEGHYVMVVADGRTSESTGLSLYEMATFLQGLGVETAYNLDGGGSSTMVFNGTVVNNPTTNGKTIRERSVSDIVYIA
jgi:exopolysaccharide biosynthesis protein